MATSGKRDTFDLADDIVAWMLRTWPLELIQRPVSNSQAKNQFCCHRG